jgi:hypothetical protein
LRLRRTGLKTGVTLLRNESFEYLGKAGQSSQKSINKRYPGMFGSARKKRSKKKISGCPATEAGATWRICEFCFGWVRIRRNVAAQKRKRSNAN